MGKIQKNFKTEFFPYPDFHSLNSAFKISSHKKS